MKLKDEIEIYLDFITVLIITVLVNNEVLKFDLVFFNEKQRNLD